jgi:PAS domain S-box-containing protein
MGTTVTDESVRSEPLAALDQALLDTLTCQAGVAFAVYDTKARYRRVSEALAALHQVSVSEHLGRRPRDVLRKDLADQVEHAVEQVLAAGTEQRDGDVVAESAGSGGPRHLEIHWLPIRDEAGLVCGVLSVVTDTTERLRQREAVRRGQWRTARLQLMTARLASALTVDEVVRTVSTLGRSIGAHRCDVRLLDADVGSPRRLPAPPGWLGRPQRPPAEWPVMLRTAIGDNTPLYLANPGELLERLPSQRAREADTDERAWVVLPLVASGAPLGVLRFVFRRERHVSEDDRVFLEALAGQCALAIERARLYEREHHTAVALQRSLLPEDLPEIPGAEVCFRYLPGASEVEVGGDWYDAFRLPCGRVAFVVGDVIGKGLPAAAGMGRVRSALRALAFTDPGPAAVLTGLDRLFSATESDESLTTLVYALIDPATGVMELADAGHLPVLVVSPDGNARLLEAVVDATPLGVAEPRTASRFTIGPGDVVVGFSDGLVENHRRGLTEGLAALLEVARGHQGSLDELLDLLLERLLAGQERTDDVTLLGFRLTAEGPGAPSGVAR